MIATTMTNTRGLGRLLAVVACAGLTIAATLGAAPPQGGAKPPATPPDPWYTRAPTIAFDSLKSPDGRFQFDSPRKDWLVIPGAGSVQVVAVSTKGAGTFLIERSVLNQPLEPTDITDLFAEIETDTLKERQPGATDVASRIIDANGHRLIGIQFNRPGFGGRQRARQYSIPMGKILYRLTCAAAESRFDAFAPLCAHVAFTLTPLAP